MSNNILHALRTAQNFVTLAGDAGYPIDYVSVSDSGSIAVQLKRDTEHPVYAAALISALDLATVGEPFHSTKGDGFTSIRVNFRGYEVSILGSLRIPEPDPEPTPGPDITRTLILDLRDEVTEAARALRTVEQHEPYLCPAYNKAENVLRDATDRLNAALSGGVL